MRLEKASYKAIKYACMKFHYAKSVPVNVFGYSVFNDKNEWCGVILYGTGANNNISKQYNLKQGNVIELVRMALNGKQQKEFIIKDNVGFGQWEWDMLANEWDNEQLEDWGLDVPEKIDKLEDGEELEIEQSLQVLPQKEYVIIYADNDSEEWEELKTIFKCKTVRQGGCTIGSTSDKATTGLERVFNLKTFKERVQL